MVNLEWAGRVVLVGESWLRDGLEYWLRTRFDLSDRILLCSHTCLHERQVFESTLFPGDLLVDPLGHITSSTLGWCQTRGVRLLSSAQPQPMSATLEALDAIGATGATDATDATGSPQGRKGPTCLLGQGGPVGIRRYFLQVALRDLAWTHYRRTSPGLYRDELARALQGEDFAQLAWLTGVDTIHFTDRDSQYFPGQFGQLRQSGPLELNAFSEGSSAQSWTPGGRFQGWSFRVDLDLLREHFTLVANGKYVHRPEMMAIAGRTTPPLRDGKLSGRREWGVCVVSRKLGAWWVGSLLDVHEARQLLPGQQVGQVQQTAGLLAALLWAVENPREGVLQPQELPYEEMLELALPWLGPCVSQAVGSTV